MALDRIAILFKVGDQPMEKSREALACKEGMPVTLIRENDWGLPLEEIITDKCGKVYASVEVNPTMDAFYQAMLEEKNPNMKESNPSLYRKRSMVIPLHDLAEKLGLSDLVERLRGSDPVSMLDGKGLVPGDFKNSLNATTPNNVIRDLNVITSGTHNVGAGETYVDWDAFQNDLGTLTGNLTGQQTSDVTDTTQADFNLDLGGYDLKLTSTSPHNGDPTAGYTSTGTATYVIRALCTNGGTFEAEKLHIIGGNPGFTSGGSGTYDIRFHDMLINATGKGTAIQMDNVNATTHMWNVALWGAGTFGLRLTTYSASDIYEHITAYNAKRGIFGAAGAYTARNILSLANSSVDYSVGGGTFTTCGSSDATGTAGLQNLVTANQVNSTDDTNSDFLNITPASTSDGAGGLTILASNTQGIRTNARPNGSNETSLGASEIVSGGIFNPFYYQKLMQGTS